MNPLLLIPLVLFSDMLLKNQGVPLGPVVILNCVGTNISCTRDGGTGYITMSGCDAGYSLGADGGCAPTGNACSPDFGLNADGGCACGDAGHPVTLCVALDGGELDGGWWCLGGAGTMKAGSAVTLTAKGAPVSMSWPAFPSAELQTQYRLNDYDAGTTKYVDHFTSDAGGSSGTPAGAFTTCFFGSNGMRDQAAPNTCSGSGVTFINTDGGYKWIQAFDAVCTNGDQVVCRYGTASSSCNSTVNSVKTYPRSSSLHCSSFTPGDAGTTGNVASCTTIQGAGTTCTYTAVPTGKIGPSDAGIWLVASDSFQADMFAGFFQGAFMTEKALSIAEMNRIGVQIMPLGIPAGMTYTRPSFKSCCDSSNRCNLVPDNIPCAILPNSSAEAQQLTNLVASSEISQSIFIAGTNPDGGVMNPQQTREDGQGPFGFTTTVKHVFMATIAWDGGVGPSAAQSSGIQASCNASGVGTVKYQAWVAGAAVELCIENSGTPTTAVCADCTPPGGQNNLILCSVTGTAPATNNAFYIGHLNSLHGAFGHAAWNQDTSWITGLQCSKNAFASDYIATTIISPGPLSPTRQTDSHTALTCAP